MEDFRRISEYPETQCALSITGFQKAPNMVMGSKGIRRFTKPVHDLCFVARPGKTCFIGIFERGAHIFGIIIKKLLFIRQYFKHLADSNPRKTGKNHVKTYQHRKKKGRNLYPCYLLHVNRKKADSYNDVR